VFYLLNREMPVNLEEITGALRALHVVDLLARGDGFGNADDLRDPLNAAIVLPEANVRIAPETPPERPRVREQQERSRKEQEAVVRQLDGLVTNTMRSVQALEGKLTADEQDRILAAMEQAAKEGKGAVSLDGRLIDIASIRMAEALIAKADSIAKAVSR